MEQEESVKIAPSQSSPEWNDYVLSFLTEEETFEGLPKVDGLRRVTKLLLGKIVYSAPTMVVPVAGEGPGRSTVIFTVKVKDVDGDIIESSDVADVWLGNIDAEYAAFSPSVASTRAEGRALRKLLGLRTICLEEVTKTVDTAREVAKASEDSISTEQVSFIEMKCKAKNIDIMKFINSGEKQYATIYDVKRETAAKMIKALRDMASGKEEIPKEIVGYDTNWRNK